jgi:hypothetical protein
MSETKGETVREIKFINFFRSNERERERKALSSFISEPRRGGKTNNNELP